MKSTIFLVASLWIITKISYCARILAYLPTPSYSHEIPFKPLWKELSLRGHEVVVITINPINDKTLINLTEIDISSSSGNSLAKMLKGDLVNNKGMSLNFVKVCIDMFRTVCDAQLGFPKVRQIIENPKEHFDVVIIESDWPVMYSFGKRFNCPIIAVSAVEPFNAVYKQLGNPTHPIVYPELRSTMSTVPTLLERVSAVFRDEIYIIFSDFLLTFLTREIITKHFGEEYMWKPPEDLVSLLLVNSNPIFSVIRPLTPTTVEIGGCYSRYLGKPLENSLNTILNNATNGFIYFSLGSGISSKNIPKNTLQVMLKTFEELPYTVLWKFDISDLENKSNNVIISTWVSQQDVLDHPKLKLFITQGGRMSVEESVFAGVPMLAMPFCADQTRNTQNMVSKGAALSINHKTLDKDTFKNTILEMINNPQYKERVKELSKLCKDQPMTGIERAVWWTEYVIRHNGTKHLRSPLLDIPWYQFYCLDVIGVIAIVIIILVFGLLVLLRILLRIAATMFQYCLVSNKQQKCE